MPAVSGRVPALTARFTAGLPHCGSIGSKAMSAREEPKKATFHGAERAMPALPVRCSR